MDEFLAKILEILKELNIKPIIYGSFGASAYLGNFKDFEDIDILIEDEFINEKWEEFIKLFESKSFNLINEKEHEFEFESKKVGFASKDILIRDEIINNYLELVQYKNTNAFTLTPGGFLKAYQFSMKDGYRIKTREKKDEDVIEKLKIYVKK
jgi:hypothetical protein